jgi:hypothetical protein
MSEAAISAYYRNAKIKRAKATYETQLSCRISLKSSPFNLIQYHKIYRLQAFSMCLRSLVSIPSEAQRASSSTELVIATLRKSFYVSIT